jgi:hypothetical protein
MIPQQTDPFRQVRPHEGGATGKELSDGENTELLVCLFERKTDIYIGVLTLVYHPATLPCHLRPVQLNLSSWSCLSRQVATGRTSPIPADKSPTGGQLGGQPRVGSLVEAVVA